ncbi:hypothetical protein E6C67_07740 [Azospirillum sp. TSA2s]|nr:hypothetical protein E6C67_07740 [Azospirillum sp. TSA2s]
MPPPQPSPALSGPMVRLPRQHKAELCARAGRGRGQVLMREGGGSPSPAQRGRLGGGLTLPPEISYRRSNVMLIRRLLGSSGSLAPK